MRRAPRRHAALRQTALATRRFAAAFGALALAMLAAVPARAQPSEPDVMMRLDQIENRMRELTGTIEQLQYRNQQLEQQLRRMQDDTEFRFQELSKGGAGARPAQVPGRGGAALPAGPVPQTASAAPPPSAMTGGAPGQPLPPVAPAPVPARGDAYDPSQNTYTPGAPRPPGARRGDAFDPNAAPDAPGAPRVLGTMPAQRVGVGQPSIMTDEQAQPAPGAPLDLSTASAAPAGPAPAPIAAAPDAVPPVSRALPPVAGGQMAALPPPAATPREEFDLAFGNIMRKDYVTGEASLRAFLRKYPNDRLAADAQFWLGEALFQRENYRDAADAFLQMSKKYDSHPKAPDALLRLGQSLAVLNEKELACATFGEVARKYPRAAANLKQAVEREQKRVRC